MSLCPPLCPTAFQWLLSLTADEQTAFPAGEDEYLDPYDPSVPRVLPLDQDIYSRHRDSKMVSQWNNMPPVVSPCWPGLYPSPAAPGEILDTSLPSDIFNAAGDKAQIIFLQIPDKFPVGLDALSFQTVSPLLSPAASLVPESFGPIKREI